MEGTGIDNENDDIVFDNAQNYHGDSDSKLSEKIIILKQVQRIASNANVEFRGGYWNSKVIPLQGGINKVTEEYVPDSREIYSNSIEYLQDVLWASLDIPGKNASDEYDATIKKMIDRYMEDGKMTDEEKLKFRESRLRLCRILFRQLCNFLKRVNWLEERSN